MAPILTIAIPSYNRSWQIQKQVRIILPQLNPKVKLIVYDNFSDTPISELFSGEELKQFVLVRNSANVGADANIARCFENCDTKWLWTLSDDDWIKDNAINLVLQQLEQTPEALYLNFWNNKFIHIQSFGELIEIFKDIRVFSASFAMSLCLYNMEKLKPYLRFYYEALNSMVGTIIFVLKYAEIHDSVECLFIDKSCISILDTEVSWNYAKYIRRSTLFLESFDEKKKKLYDNTLFRGYHLTNYYLISLNRASSRITLTRRFKLLRFAVYTQGIFNVLKYNFSTVARLYLHLILETKGLNWILKLKHRLFHSSSMIDNLKERFRELK